MKSFIITALTLTGLALATPLQKRQDLPMDLYKLLPKLPDVGAPVGDSGTASVSYNPTSAASAAAAAVTIAADDSSSAGVVTNIGKRTLGASCTTRSFNGPRVTVPTDSPSAFLNYAPFAASASAAAQPSAIPSGYALVPEFVNLHAAAQDSHYLTYTTVGMTGYLPSVCAAKCNVMSGCTAFNIYYERTPLVISTLTQVPDAVSCPGNTNSSSATLIKCAFYGINLDESMATNVGQFQGKFQVVMAGSNAYVKSAAPTLPGYEGPVDFHNAAINAPAPVIDHGYLRVQTFGQNVPFDPSLCAASCAAQTDYNLSHDTGLGPCYFFNVYVLQENGANGVLTCTYFSTPYNSSYATMTGQFDQQSNFFGVTQSYGYYVNGHFAD